MYFWEYVAKFSLTTVIAKLGWNPMPSLVTQFFKDAPGGYHGHVPSVTGC